MLVFKNLIFILTIIYAGYIDFKKKIIPDRVHVIIMLSSLLIDFNLCQSITGLLFLPIPFILSVFFNEDTVGGGDIKIVGAIGFFLGLRKGTIAIIIGLTISVIFNLFIFNKNRNDSFPLAPYIAIGSFLSLLIFSF
ncbi:prepilin peptidase [Xylanivirga thermophila]|uniref:prepilin peptidase n=1 Tax=Xylanivirga thermophila TaxID=2496273 RepID=UPI00101D348B